MCQLVEPMKGSGMTEHPFAYFGTVKVSVWGEDGTTEGSDQRPQDRRPFGDDFPPNLVGKEDRDAFRLQLMAEGCLACPSATSDADHTHRFIPPLAQIVRYDDASFGS
jgi:hypothetical protein